MTDMTKEAILGYHNARYACPYLYSSASSIAWHLGAYFQDTGRAQPRNVRMSRGYKIRANDMMFEWSRNNRFERIS